MRHGGKASDASRAEGRRWLPRPDEPIFDQGLAFDLETLFDRRRMLRLLGFSGLGLALAGCGLSSDGGGGSTGAAGTTEGAGATDASCSTIPEETAGPYPADGSNGPDVLAQSGIVRRDIRPSFGEFTGVADGIDLSIRLNLQDASACTGLGGAAVYLWHCDRGAEYSLYTVTDQNYLRGVQAADGDGVVTFTSVFPGCYAGRWPHVHFEVYPSLEAATDDANVIATSQIALPEDVCERVYSTAGYEGSVANLAQISLESDMVFGDDGGVHQLGTVTGDLEGGLTVELTVPV
jgi:protocatechuate 3,4-dioxygenase beta subunit